MASIQKRGENSWLLVVEAGYDAKGKRIRRTKTIRVEDEKLLRTTKKLNDHLKLELAKFKMQVEAGEYIAPEKKTLSDFANEWKEKKARKDFSPTTFKSYESILKNHILPNLGHRRMEQIKTLEIVDFLHALSEPGTRKDGREGTLSDRTIAEVYRVLKSIFDKAVTWRLISESPLESIEKPRFEEKEMQYYDAVEAREIIAALYKEDTMWKVFFLGAMFGGLRRGELLALTWKDIDFDNQTINIDKNLVLFEKGKPIIKRPKTKSSLRKVEMPSWYMDELKEYRLQWKQAKFKLGSLWEGEEHEYIFHGGTGKPLYQTTPTTKWRRFIEKHGLKYVRLHDLRHTMVALLIEDGASLKAIQERAGHSSSKVTADIYGHVTRRLSKETAERFDKFNPKKFVNNSSTSKKNA